MEPSSLAPSGSRRLTAVLADALQARQLLSGRSASDAAADDDTDIADHDIAAAVMVLAEGRREEPLAGAPRARQSSS